MGKNIVLFNASPANILPLFEKVKEKRKFFQTIKFVWTPREENELADALSNGKTCLD